MTYANNDDLYAYVHYTTSNTTEEHQHIILLQMQPESLAPDFPLWQQPTRPLWIVHKTSIKHA